MNKIDQIRKKIQDRVLELNVQTKHSESGHFYFVPELGETYGSVTGLQYIIKDPSIELFMKNETLRYIRRNFAQMTPDNLEEHLENAGNASITIRDTAGGFGTTIHDLREEYFKDWIITGTKPRFSIEDLAKRDPMCSQEVRSGCAGLDKFLTETGYIPLGCEIMVYSKKWKIAGCLDDVGLLPIKIPVPNTDGGYKIKYELVLCDLKTSNMMKSFYTCQVGAYYKMFIELFRMRPKKCFILKVGKEHRDYQIEWLPDMKLAVRSVQSLVDLSADLRAIDEIRKPKAVQI